MQYAWDVKSTICHWMAYAWNLRKLFCLCCRMRYAGNPKKPSRHRMRRMVYAWDVKKKHLPLLDICMESEEIITLPHEICVESKKKSYRVNELVNLSYEKHITLKSVIKCDEIRSLIYYENDILEYALPSYGENTICIQSWKKAHKYQKKR